MLPTDLESGVARFPETVFMMGSRYEFLGENVREFDRQKHLSLRDILEATPSVWIHLPPFAVGRRMVTNGEYRAFLESVDDAGARIYDGPGIWRYVWNDLNLRLERMRVPFERAPGEIVEFEEDYTGARGAVEAYLESLRYETQRVLLSGGIEEPAGEAGYESSQMLLIRGRGEEAQAHRAPLEKVLRPAFAMVRYFLRDTLLLPGEDLFTLLNERDQDVLHRFDTPAKACELFSQLINELRRAYRNRIERRYLMAFQTGHFRIEGVDFFSRLREHVRQMTDVGAPVLLREILYPRYWPGPQGRVGAQEFRGVGVPWDEQPVYGVTLYEAAAYAAWLERATGRLVMLPNEAQFERASSWPVEEFSPDGGDCVVDPGRKLAFPWQDHNPSRDFNYYFGKEGAELADFYFKNRRKYEELLEETARLVNSRERVYQLEGFGWQWTRDRHDPDESKYRRFQDPEYPRFTARAARLKGREGAVEAVCDYQDSSNVRCARFVMKGSPDILGGPGLTPRRYAASPLRAYPNVGFRIAVQES